MICNLSLKVRTSHLNVLFGATNSKRYQLTPFISVRTEKGGKYWSSYLNAVKARKRDSGIGGDMKGRRRAKRKNQPKRCLVSQEDVNDFNDMHTEGLSNMEISRRTGWAEATVRRYINMLKAGVPLEGITNVVGDKNMELDELSPDELSQDELRPWTYEEEISNMGYSHIKLPEKEDVMQFQERIPKAPAPVISATADKAPESKRVPMNRYRMSVTTRLKYEPQNEMEVVALFAELGDYFPFSKYEYRVRFPDCIAYVGSKKCYIEFERVSSNFKRHGHPMDGCDVVVCWEDDINLGEDMLVIPLEKLVRRKKAIPMYRRGDEPLSYLYKLRAAICST